MKFLFGVGIHGHLYALVIDHDLVLRFDVVVDQHLFAAYHGIAAYLARVQPANPKIGHHAVREIEAEISHIMEPLFALHIYAPACARRDGCYA